MAHRWTNVYCRHWFKRIGTSQNAAIHEPAIQKDPWRKSFQRFVLTWLQCWRTKCIGGAILHSHFRAILDRWGRKTEQFCRGGEIADRCGETIKWSRRQGPSGRNGTGAKKRYWRGCRNTFLCFVCMFIFCEGTVWCIELSNNYASRGIGLPSFNRIYFSSWFRIIILTLD